MTTFLTILCIMLYLGGMWMTIATILLHMSRVSMSKRRIKMTTLLVIWAIGLAFGFAFLRGMR